MSHSTCSTARPAIFYLCAPCAVCVMQVLPACQVSTRAWVEAVSARSQPGMEAKVRREQEALAQRHAVGCCLSLSCPPVQAPLLQFTFLVSPCFPAQAVPPPPHPTPTQRASNMLSWLSLCLNDSHNPHTPHHTHHAPPPQASPTSPPPR